MRATRDATNERRGRRRAVVTLVALVVAGSVVAPVAAAGTAAEMTGGERSPAAGGQSPAAGTGGAGPVTEEPGNETPAVTGSVVARHVDDTTVEYTVSMSVDADVETLTFHAVDARGFDVTATEGFDRSGRAVYDWDGETNDPTVTLSVDYAGIPESLPAGVVHEDWLVGVSYGFRLEWDGGDGDGGGELFMEETGTRSGWSARAEGGVIAPELFVYFGEYETVDLDADDERVRVVVPAAADVDRADLELTGQTAAAFPVDPNAGVTTVGLVVPAVGTEGYDGVVVNSWQYTDGLGTADRGEAFLAVEGSGPRVWLEEYLHTQQSFSATHDMGWLHDAVVGYYKRYYQYRFGDRPYEWFVNWMTNPRATSDATLHDPGSWDSLRPRYQKGPKVIAYLDWRIRELTDGERSFADVQRRLNDQEGTVGLPEFKDSVAGVVGGDELDDEIDRYVTTDAFPNATAYPAASAPGEGNASKYVGTDHRTVAVNDSDDGDIDTAVNVTQVSVGDETTTADAGAGGESTDTTGGTAETAATAGTPEDASQTAGGESEPQPGFGWAVGVVAVLAALALLRRRR